MKKIVYIIALLTVSCGDYNKSADYVEGQDIWVGEITYFKDTRTNLCFGMVYHINTMTCVPCDSVKNLIP